MSILKLSAQVNNDVVDKLYVFYKLVLIQIQDALVDKVGVHIKRCGLKLRMVHAYFLSRTMLPVLLPPITILQDIEPHSYILQHIEPRNRQHSTRY